MSRRKWSTQGWVELLMFCKTNGLKIFVQMLCTPAVEADFSFAANPLLGLTPGRFGRPGRFC